jgi:hypothetical protein
MGVIGNVTACSAGSPALDFVYRHHDFREYFHAYPTGHLIKLPASNIWCSRILYDLPMLSVMVHVKCHG